MSLDKTLLTLTTLRDGIKILWGPAAFWIAKDQQLEHMLKSINSMKN